MRKDLFWPPVSEDLSSQWWEDMAGFVQVGAYGKNLILQRTRKQCGPGTRGRAITFKDPPLETFFSY